MKKVYVYDSETKKVVEKSTLQHNHSAAVHTFNAFTSPIDGTRIRDSAQLRSHNRKHGVTDQRDYGPDWFARESKSRDDRLTGATKADKQDRLNALNRAYEQQRG
ncbi:MAG: hypothetical protein DRQ98_12155 [Gammaproteobacteria bacterium]|nr:MAG: hypothetical protein DRQ98_12155 [Gammaproteobacteria bacterium]